MKREWKKRGPRVLGRFIRLRLYEAKVTRIARRGVGSRRRRMAGLLLLIAGASAAPLHRNYVYARFLRDGSAPTWADLARDFALSREETDAAFEQLAVDHDAVPLTSISGASSKNYLLMAHPFSNLPTCHSAYHDQDAVQTALVKLVKAVPCLTPRLFLRPPAKRHYGN